MEISTMTRASHVCHRQYSGSVTGNNSVVYLFSFTWLKMARGRCQSRTPLGFTSTAATVPSHAMESFAAGPLGCGHIHRSTQAASTKIVISTMPMAYASCRLVQAICAGTSQKTRLDGDWR